MKARAAWAHLLEHRAGLAISRGGVASALAAHLEARSDLEEDAVARGAIDEERLAELLDAITVSHSWLFRDVAHFEALSGWMRARRSPIRAWIPGCAAGEDAFTLAAVASTAGATVEIFGTDVNRAALARATRGELAVGPGGIPPEHARHFTVRGSHARPSAAIAARVRFARHNVTDPPPPRERGWDLIVCRNVLIYFTAAAIDRALDRFATALAPDGRLLLGPNDVFSALPPGLAPTPALGRILLERRPPLPRRSELAPQPPPRARAAPAAPRVARGAGPKREGDAKLAAGDTAGALACYLVAIERDPVDAEARLLAGIALRERGELASAAQMLRGALFLAPDSWPAAYHLARALEALGEADEATRELARFPIREHGPAAPTSDLWAHQSRLVARAKKKTE